MSRAPRIACAVLAAGASRRLGSPKQLLAIEGRPLIARIVETVCGTRADHVAVVLGAHADEVGSALPRSRASVLHNPAWQSGLASTLHVAVHWARALSADALLLTTCDQPLLSTTHLDRMCRQFARDPRTLASSYANTLGVPSLIEAQHFDALLALEGDRGAAALLRSNIEVHFIDWPEGALDLDTADDVASFHNLKW